MPRGLKLTIIAFWLFFEGNGQPLLGTYPPQVHQQICQESTYTRYLDVFNYGDSTLAWNAVFTPGPYDWVTAEPPGGEIEPGDTIQIAFIFNSTGLALDNYYSYLQINSNDPFNADTIILAMLHVQQITVFVEPENDSICFSCNTTLHTMAFGCSEEYQFSWTSDPPGFTSTEKSPVVTPQVNTTYTVYVTDGGGSAEKSVYIQVYGSSDIDEEQSLSEFSVFPNPCQGQFTLSFISKIKGTVIASINDISGREVFSNKIELQPGHCQYNIDPGYLEPGLYFFSIQDKENLKKKIDIKFIVQ
jgi:hypothetical protein